MLIELAQPISLLLCILSLYGVFHTAFLAPGNDLEQRILGSLGLLALSAGICLVSAQLFRDGSDNPAVPGRALTSALPFQLFCWAASAMLVLFIASWYLETHCVFYRDAQRF